MGAFLNRLLSRLGHRPSWAPLHESARVQRQFARWVAARTYLNWTGPWFRAYHYQRAGLPTEWPVEALQPDASARGLVLFYDARIGGANFHHLFRLLRDRILAQGYHVAQADERRWAGSGKGESLAKYVLHPRPGTCVAEQACDQRFGQVTLDLVSRGREPAFLRLLALPLPGTVFNPARPFDELVERVLGVDAE